MEKIQTAIITGGSRGIGKEIAIALARKKVNVVICSRTQEHLDVTVAELRKIHSQVLGIKCDVSAKKQVDSLVNETLNKFKDIDILVNNAGIALVKKLVDTTDEEWNSLIDINLTGAFNCTKAVLPHMISRNSGTIINMASGAGKVGFENLSAYCASKFGMMGMAQSLTWEVANTNIRVMSVCPGEVDTDMQRDADPEYYKQNHESMICPSYVAERVIHLVYDDIACTNGHVEDIYNRPP